VACWRRLLWFPAVRCPATPASYLRAGESWVKRHRWLSIAERSPLRAGDAEHFTTSQRFSTERGTGRRSAILTCGGNAPVVMHATTGDSLGHWLSIAPPTARLSGQALKAGSCSSFVRNGGMPPTHDALWTSKEALSRESLIRRSGATDLTAFVNRDERDLSIWCPATEAPPLKRWQSWRFTGTAGVLRRCSTALQFEPQICHLSTVNLALLDDDEYAFISLCPIGPVEDGSWGSSLFGDQGMLLNTSINWNSNTAF